MFNFCKTMSKVYSIQNDRTCCYLCSAVVDIGTLAACLNRKTHSLPANQGAAVFVAPPTHYCSWWKRGYFGKNETDEVGDVVVFLPLWASVGTFILI